MAHLVLREPGRVAFSTPLAESLDVGRGDDNELVIFDRAASRKHARFSRAPDGYRIVDLGSTHGTYVNGLRIEDKLLEDGDEVQIGGALLGFRSLDQAAPEVAQTRTEATMPSSAVAERRLRVLYDVGRAIGALDEPDVLAARMLDAILDVLGCERGMVGITDGTGGGRRLSRSRRADARDDDPIVSRAHIEAMVTRRESVLLRDLQPAPPSTLGRQGVRSAIGAPLVAGGRTLGFVYLDDRARADCFTGDNLEFLTALAHLLAAALGQAEHHRRATTVAAALREAHVPPEMLGVSPAMQRLRSMTRKYALAADAPVLIRGESGTGKELVANLIHSLSSRAEEAFVAVNCAAIPEPMIEAELFGHDKGAFTGATKARRGKFAIAHRGTIFLDEIGDLSLPAQAKVLRTLQDGCILPLGVNTPLQLDVRVVSATHKDLEAEIAAGRFREDLYYRLRVGELSVPPLRERGDDVALLARAFLERAARRLGKSGLELGPAALERLSAYGWPGNIRQLKNEVERAAIICEGKVIELADLMLPDDKRRAASAGVNLAEDWQTLLRDRAALDDSEKRLIAAAMQKHGGVVARAARELGVPRTSLLSRIQTLGLDEPEGS